MKDDEDAGTQSGADEDLDLMTLGCVHLTLDTALPLARENRKECESLYNSTLVGTVLCLLSSCLLCVNVVIEGSRMIR